MNWRNAFAAAAIPASIAMLAPAALAQTAGSPPTYRSVTAPAAVLYDGPSAKARKLFVAPRGMPLEVLSTVGQWVKVRDIAGDVVWVERGDVGERRAVQTTAIVYVRQAPQDSAPLVFQADRGVLLDLVEPDSKNGWLHVRHRDGTAGWVRAAEVWGY